jgi:hypothetical protein
VLAQVALSLTLLSGAGLLARSLVRLWAVDPGFAPDHALAVRITLVKNRYPDPEAVRLFYDRVTARLRELPEVSSAGVTSVVPLSGVNSRTDFRIAGRDESDPARLPGARDRWIDADFATSGFPCAAAACSPGRTTRAPGVPSSARRSRRASGGERTRSARLHLQDSELTTPDRGHRRPGQALRAGRAPRHL